MKKSKIVTEITNGGPGYGDYGGAVIPMIPGQMCGSPMYGSEPYVWR